MATIHKEKRLCRAMAAVAVALCCGVSQLSVAQDPKALNIDVQNCVSLEKPEERLACFEAQVEAARQRAPASSPSEATGASTPAVAGAATVPVAGASTPAVAGASTAGVAAPSTAAVAGPSTASPAAPAVSQKSASEPRSAENFGFPEPPPEPRAERSPQRQQVEIVATVTELRQTVPNAYVITLDNGQVWRQAHPMPYPLRVGLVVRVRETGFGYRLTAPELHGQINVERVR
jgi:hypothetical protein